MKTTPTIQEEITFQDSLGLMGYVLDSAHRTYVKRGAYVTLEVNMNHTSKGAFKHISCRLILTVVSPSFGAAPHVFNFKPSKKLSVAYIKKCEECVQNISTQIDAMFNSISNLTSTVDPKEIESDL